jgi:hypothetical protein
VILEFKANFTFLARWANLAILFDQAVTPETKFALMVYVCESKG